MADLFKLLGWLVGLVLVALVEAWVYVECYQAWGYWGVFWAVIGMGLIVALVKFAAED
jgi:hypothetical protein